MDVIQFLRRFSPRTQRPLPAWIQALFGVALAIFAVLLRYSLDFILVDYLPYSFSLSAVAIAGLLGSWRAGVPAAVVGLFCCNYFFVSPRFSLDVTVREVAGTMSFAVLTGILLFVAEQVHRGYQQLSIAAERLRAANDDKASLLAEVAHELRSPLSALCSASLLLKTGQADSSEVADVMERQLRLVTRLTDDLWDASSVQLGRVDLQLSDVPLSRVMETAVEAVAPLTSSKKQTVRVSGASLEVRVDPARASQVFSNLLQNAAKFSPIGAWIDVTLSTEGSFASVQIKDEGPGIPRERLGWVFDSYTQLNPSTGGLGLGLSLVKRLVELHGGTVRASSDGPGKGATFEVRLPLSRLQGAPV